MPGERAPLQRFQLCERVRGGLRAAVRPVSIADAHAGADAHTGADDHRADDSAIGIGRADDHCADMRMALVRARLHGACESPTS